MKNYPRNKCYDRKLQKQEKRCVLVAKLVHVFAGISSGFGIVKNLLVKRTGITLNVKPDIQQRPYPPNEQNEFQGFVIPRPVARKVSTDDSTGPF